MQYTVSAQGQLLPAQDGELLLDVLRRHNLAPDAPCGGHGRCGKCRVEADGRQVLACQFPIHSDCTVLLPRREDGLILTEAAGDTVPADPIGPGYSAAFDIGTTTVVCYLLAPDGRELAAASMHNPQHSYGADVISRIQQVQKGNREALTACIRQGMCQLLDQCCQQGGIQPQQIGVVSVVANPCMQQLFLGMEVDNLASVPFAPRITHSAIVPAGEYLSLCPQAQLLVVPNISGYVGADTLGCVLASRMYEGTDTVLLVDIGTNGEMVLSHQGAMVACSTAAGPALEGANIQCGMRGCTGAISHITLAGCTVIGGGPAVGICGSGLIDAVALMLRQGLLNKRGRVLTPDHSYALTPAVRLTQEDIRQVQMAKGAIAAGIELMAQYMGISLSQIHRVILAGAFGTFLNPDSACRIGLIPEVLAGKITAAGNLAGSGSKLMAKSKQQFALAQSLQEQIAFLELASLPNFQRTFAKNMTFREESE